MLPVAGIAHALPDAARTGATYSAAAGGAKIDTLSTEVKQKIQTVKDSQVQVRDAMDKLHHEYCPDCFKE